jgi:signal transduction histidine kinase
MALSLHEIRHYSDRKVFASLGAIIMVALIATAFILVSLHSFLASRQSSIQITKTQAQLESFYIEILNAETGQRGYLLTGDMMYLVPYTQAVKEMPKQEASLMQQSKPYSYAPEITTMIAATKAKFQELQSTIYAYQTQGSSAALAIVATGAGQSDMERIRTLVDEVSRAQSVQLADTRAQTNLYGMLTAVIGAAMLIAIALLAVLVYYLFIQAIKAERALDLAKNEFVSLASHQLRTPASGIKSILSVLISQDVGPLNSRQQQLIERAAESNQRELKIVEELLNVAKAQAGKLTLKQTKTDMCLVIGAVLTELAPLTEAKHQNIRMEGPDHAVWVDGDEAKLHMAMSNLVDNASKYTQDNGDITIKIREQARTVKVAVSDSGAGIEGADIVNIFDRFVRAQGSRTTGVDGSGLGLYLVRQIIRLHNGTIEVKSRKGRGSTFTVIMPRRGAHHAA